MKYLILLLAIAAGYLILQLRRDKKKRPTARALNVPETAVPIVRRSYSNGLGRSEAATAPEADESEERDVTFAAESTGESTIPTWEGLRGEPLFVLGPEGEDGSAREYLVAPPESPYRPAKDPESGMDWSLVDDFADDPEPNLTDVTDEEKQAIRDMDVRAFQ